jgi:hypothetical protein
MNNPKDSKRFAPYRIRKRDDVDDISSLLKKSAISEKRFKPPSIRKKDQTSQLTDMMSKISLNNKQEELRQFAADILQNLKKKE